MRSSDPATTDATDSSLIVASWLLMPGSVLSQLQEQTVAGTGSGEQAQATSTPEGAGTPDSGGAAGLTASPIVAPYVIQVVQGDEAALGQSNCVSDSTAMQEGQFGNNLGNVMTFEQGQTQTVFQHPTLDGYYVVITDWVSQFPGREAQAEATAGTWQPLLTGLTFVGEDGMFDYTGFGE